MEHDMKCPTSGNDNLTDAQFCGMCGTQVSASQATGIGGTSSELPMVSFINATKLGFSNYFRFSGRSTRAEYWWWMLFIIFASMIIGIADSSINAFAADGQLNVLSDLFALATLNPYTGFGGKKAARHRKVWMVAARDYNSSHRRIRVICY